MFLLKNIKYNSLPWFMFLNTAFKNSCVEKNSYYSNRKRNAELFYTHFIFVHSADLLYIASAFDIGKNQTPINNNI